MNTRLKDDDMQSVIAAEDLAKRVADRLAASEHTYTYVDWDSDQVDGSLSEVVAAVVEELGRTA